MNEVSDFKKNNLFQKYIFKNEIINNIKNFFIDYFNYNDELDEIHNILSNNKFNNVDDLKYFHNLSILGKNDRNNIFINEFHQYIDKNYEFNYLYLKFIKEYIKPLFNNKKIVFQKTPNIRMSLPNLTAIGKYEDNENFEIIGLHKDSDFGHIEDEINFIIPITKMFNTNSIYFEKSINSNDLIDNYQTLKLNENEFFRGYFNQIKHCNKINLTDKTRISFDMRVILYDDYIKNIDKIKNTKFELGKYFVLL